MSAIEKLSISLTPQQVAWIEDQMRAGGYGNRSEYIRDLIRQEQRRRELTALQEKLAGAGASPQSGEGMPADEAWFAAQKTKLEQALRSRPQGG